MKIRKLTLLVASLAMVLGIGTSALAQGTQEHHAQEPPAQQQPQTQDPQAQQPQTQGPPAQEPPAQQPQTQGPPAQEPQVELSCADIFREEQRQLAETGVYPTPVSDEARACEDSGEVNTFPPPIFSDSEGFLYVLDPIADRYTSHDPATGLLHIYDLVTHTYYTYDLASGTYV